MQGLIDFFAYFFLYWCRSGCAARQLVAKRWMAGGGGRRLRLTYCAAVLPPRGVTCGFSFRRVLPFPFWLAVAMEETVGQGDA